MRMRRNSPASIWLYSHHHGEHFPTMLQEALRTARPRWGLPEYCARVIAQHFMTTPLPPGPDPVLGWGLGLQFTDSRYNVLELDMEKQQVRTRLRDEREPRYFKRKLLGYALSFEEYIGLADPAYFRKMGLTAWEEKA